MIRGKKAPSENRWPHHHVARSISWLAVVPSVLVPGIARAHGETAARGGMNGAINTVGATMLPHGTWSAGLRLEARAYDEFTDEELLGFARAGEDVHMHSQEFSGFLYSSWAFTDDWALDLVLPVNAFRGFREGTLNDTGDAEIIRDDFSGGVGDLLLFSRYRLMHRDPHHAALLMGVKLPTGDTRQTDNRGQRIGAHNQPGSGSIDFQFGLAYTLELERWEVSADALAHIRTQGAMRYQAGNALQADLAVSYSLEVLAPVIELNGIWAQRDIEDGEALKNSGLRVLYVSPGLLVRLAHGHVMFATFQYPLLQPLPGIQNPERFRASIGYSFALGSHDESNHHDH